MKSIDHFLFSLMKENSSEFPPTCGNLVARIRATCNVMDANLNRMAEFAKGGITLNLMRFVQASAPFIMKVLGFQSFIDLMKGFRN